MMKFVELSEQERKAVKEALEYMGYFDVAESPEMLQEDITKGAASDENGVLKECSGWTEL